MSSLITFFSASSSADEPSSDESWEYDIDGDEGDILWYDHWCIFLFKVYLTETETTVITRSFIVFTYYGKARLFQVLTGPRPGDFSKMYTCHKQKCTKLSTERVREVSGPESILNQWAPEKVRCPLKFFIGQPKSCSQTKKMTMSYFLVFIAHTWIKVTTMTVIVMKEAFMTICAELASLRYLTGLMTKSILPTHPNLHFLCQTTLTSFHGSRHCQVCSL